MRCGGDLRPRSRRAGPARVGEERGLRSVGEAARTVGGAPPGIAIRRPTVSRRLGQPRVELTDSESWTTLLVMVRVLGSRLVLALLVVAVGGLLAACGGTGDSRSIESAIVDRIAPGSDEDQPEVPVDLEPEGLDPSPSLADDPAADTPASPSDAPPSDPPASAPAPSTPQPAPGASDPAPGAEAAELPAGAEIAAGELAAGRYTPTEFTPGLSFVLGEGWSGLQPDLVDFLSLSRTSNDELSLSFLSPGEFVAVLDPDKDYVQDPTADDLLDPSAVDFAELLRGHRHYTSGPLVSTTVAGYDAVLFESAVTSGYAYRLCPRRCVLLFATSDRTLFGSLVGSRERTLVVDVGGEQLIVSISAPQDEFADFLPVAEEVLETLEIEGGPPATTPPARPEPGSTPEPAPEPPAPPADEPEEPPVYDPGVELPDRPRLEA